MINPLAHFSHPDRRTRFHFHHLLGSEISQSKSFLSRTHTNLGLVLHYVILLDVSLSTSRSFKSHVLSLSSNSLHSLRLSPPFFLLLFHCLTSFSVHLVCFFDTLFSKHVQSRYRIFTILGSEIQNTLNSRNESVCTMRRCL